MTIKLTVRIEPVDETVVLVLLQEREVGQSGNFKEIARQSLNVTRDRTSRVFELEPGAYSDRMSLTLTPGKLIVHDDEQYAVTLEDH